MNLLLIGGLLAVGIVATCAQRHQDSEEYVRYQIEVQYEPPKKIRAEFTPLPPSKPKNWWGTTKEPVVWPE